VKYPDRASPAAVWANQVVRQLVTARVASMRASEPGAEDNRIFAALVDTVVTECLGDGDLDEIGARVAWLCSAATVYAFTGIAFTAKHPDFLELHLDPLPDPERVDEVVEFFASVVEGLL
jgi:hypothetical protein